MAQYLPIVVMLVLGVLFAGVSLVMSRLVSPKRPSAAKSAPYECGIVPRQDPPERFPVRFYLVAMIFFGSMTALLCYLLHRRDQLSETQRSAVAGAS